MSGANWRPVAEGLPDADLCVLIACDTTVHSEPVWIGYHNGDSWREVNGEPAFVTHWAQLPSPPDGVTLAPAPTAQSFDGITGRPYATGVGVPRHQTNCPPCTHNCREGRDCPARTGGAA